TEPKFFGNRIVLFQTRSLGGAAAVALASKMGSFSSKFVEYKAQNGFVFVNFSLTWTGTRWKADVGVTDPRDREAAGSSCWEAKCFLSMRYPGPISSSFRSGRMSRFSPVRTRPFELLGLS